jgi:hypothetical protein
MINKKDYFKWMVKTNEGKIYFTDGIKLKDLIPPYTFSLLDGYKVISEVDIKQGEERIYFRRVFNKNTNLSPTHVLKILYCIGKKIGDIYYCDIIHPITKEVTKYTGKNLDEVMNLNPEEMK